jgi:hypothetical protein
LYRYLQTLFERSNHWQGYDLFRKQKDETFRKSAAAVGELATRYHGLSEQLKNDGANEEALRLLFREFVDISLWGNATDLSLLVSVSLEQLQTLQGSDARKKNEKNILVNHVDDAWEIVCSEVSTLLSGADLVCNFPNVLRNTNNLARWSSRHCA